MYSGVIQIPQLPEVGSTAVRLGLCTGLLAVLLATLLILVKDLAQNLVALTRKFS